MAESTEKQLINTWQHLLTVASTDVLLQTYGSIVLTLCRFSCIRLEFSGSRTYWIKAMSSYRTQKVLPQKRYNPAEEWDYLEEDTLKHTRSASVCMTCQHFNYCFDRHSRTILTYHLHQRLIPHGDHLTSKYLCWRQRLERKIGWCPEAAWSNDQRTACSQNCKRNLQREGKARKLSCLSMYSQLFLWPFQRWSRRYRRTVRNQYLAWSNIYRAMNLSIIKATNTPLKKTSQSNP